MSDRIAARIDEFMESYRKNNLFSGILRVTYRDNILYQKCVGIEDLETSSVITEQSRFNFYSLSKPFCAIGLIKLIEKGKVSFEDHPSRYVPEAAGFDKAVTVYHILHHISGMTDYNQHAEYEALCASKEKFDVRLLVKKLAEYPMRFKPGTGSQYANINFTLAALIIENVTGLSYAEYMEKEVLKPLSVENARIDEPGLTVEHRVIGMDVINDKLVPVGNNIGWMLGAGDMIGDINDAYRLNHAIKYRMLLSDRMWDEILRPSEVNNFGCGCSVTYPNGKTRIQHNGGHIGFRTLHIQYLEDDLDIILLSNSGTADPRVVFADFISAEFYSLK